MFLRLSICNLPLKTLSSGITCFLSMTHLKCTDMKNMLATVLIFLMCFTMGRAQNQFESDMIKTSAGDLKMYYINHATLMFTFNDLVIHIDPVSRATDYTKMPKADIILVTHQHGDHLDKSAIDLLKKTGTDIILTESCREQISEGTIMHNGDTKMVKGIKIEAVPAYNLVHKRDNGEPFHPKGIGNGYVLIFGNKRVYVAGDTENVPEMRDLKNINIAFLPMNLPYTMTPEMVADAVRMFNPEIVIPYHFGNTDRQKLVDLLSDKKNTEIWLRKFY